MYDFFEAMGMDSDLACERRRADTSLRGVIYKRETTVAGDWERIKITDAEGEKSIGRPIGSYDTLSLDRMDLLSAEEVDDAVEEVARELCRLFDARSILPSRILVIGLGNRELTSDSVGPRTAELVNATMQIKEYDPRTFSMLECSEIAVLSSGVSADSGIDSALLIGGVCDMIHPDAVIAIDSLAARSEKRLGRTIQLSDTGIFPGSGIGNPRGAVTEKTVGAPVIAIGVPTVIDARLFCSEGRLRGEAMFVSPKEINGIVRSAARIISGGINQAFGITV